MSFAQTGEIYIDKNGFKYLIYEGDTCAFYNKKELKRIADRVVRAKECDTLLNIAYRDLEYADSIIAAKDSTITSGKEIIRHTNTIAEEQKKDIDELVKVNNKDNRIIKWLKVGWATTSAVLVAAVIYFILL